MCLQVTIGNGTSLKCNCGLHYIDPLLLSIIVQRIVTTFWSIFVHLLLKYMDLQWKLSILNRSKFLLKEKFVEIERMFKYNLICLIIKH